MFSIFKKKHKPLSMMEMMQQSVDELRADFSDETLSKAFAIDDKIRRLGSKKLEYFNELLGTTDDVADRIWLAFEGLPPAKKLEIHGLVASIVASAIKASDLPAHEKLQIIDIYLDLWAGAFVQYHPTVDGVILRGSIEKMWQGLLPGILRAVADAEAVKLGFPNPPLALVQSIDTAWGLQRSEAAQIEAGAVLKEIIIFAMATVHTL